MTKQDGERNIALLLAFVILYGGHHKFIIENAENIFHASRSNFSGGKNLSKCYWEEIFQQNKHTISMKSCQSIFYIWSAEELTMLYTKAHQRFCFTVFMVSLLSSKASSSCIEIKRLTTCIPLS